MKQQNIVVLPKTIIGQVIGTKEQIEVRYLSKAELESLLKEFAKFDYLFTRGRIVVSVEFKLNDVPLFVDMTEKEYKQLCDFYFLIRREDSKEEIEKQ